MQKPLVSMVLVVRNVDRFLSESIESVLGQTFKDFEFIIVDFGSTDRSKAIVQSYAAKDGRIRVHEISSCGLAEARNAAWRLAQGQYIAPMDADDVSLPNRLMLEVEFMENHPEVALLGSATEWIDVAGRFLRKDCFPTQHDDIKSALVTHCPFCQATMLIRREALDLVGGYRAMFAQSEDYDLWLRIAEHFECANLEQAVLKYRIHPYQVSIRKRREQTLCKLAAQASALERKNGYPDPLNGVEEITPAVLSGLGVTETTLQNAIASDCHNWIRSMYIAREYSGALKAAVELLQSDRQYVERWLIADLYLTVARLYWRQGRRLSSVLSGVRAVLTHPAMVGRPLKPLLGRLGFVQY